MDDTALGNLNIPMSSLFHRIIMKQGVRKKGFDLIIKGSNIKMDPPIFENLEYENDTQNGIAVPNSSGNLAGS